MSHIIWNPDIGIGTPVDTHAAHQVIDAAAHAPEVANEVLSAAISATQVSFFINPNVFHELPVSPPSPEATRPPKPNGDRVELTMGGVGWGLGMAA